MVKHILTFLLVLVISTANAQGRDDFFSRLGVRPVGKKANNKENFFIRAGLNAGGSQLFHNTLFETTNMAALWKTISFSHKPPESYTWENFAQDYDIHKSFFMPRYGVNFFFSTRYLPVFANLELMTSPSSYQKALVGFSFGPGKDFRLFDRDIFFSAHGGLKVVKDWGLGYETFTNSIGNREARNYIETYYKPNKPAGSQWGLLSFIKVGAGHVLGSAERSAIGVECYFEWDMTNETYRPTGTRMTNAGVNLYFRVDLAQTSF